MRSLLFNAFFFGYTFYTALKLYILARTSTRERMLPAIRLWGETVLRAVEVILRSKVEVRGLHNVPAHGRILLVSKHQSELDVVVLAALFPHTGAVAMKELERYPFFGVILDKLDLVLVHVDAGPQNRTEETVEGARRIFDQDRPMMIYPEGELMALGAKERYRRGAAHIYTRTGAVAVPVAASLGVIWPKREWRKHTGRTAAVEFLEPIPPGLDFDTFHVEIERRIEDQTMRLIREHAKGEVLEAAEDRHARGANNHG